MGPAYYVIAILGCADGSTQCTPVATIPARYESQATCSAAVLPTLAQQTEFDFPTVMAECRPMAQPIAGADDTPTNMPANALRG